MAIIESLKAQQAELDKFLELKLDLTAEETLQDKMDWLFLEITECFNETKFQKYAWDEPIDRAKLLEEYADCIHFSVSIANHYGFKLPGMQPPVEEFPKKEALRTWFRNFVRDYRDITWSNQLSDGYLKTRLEEYVKKVIILGSALQFTEEEIINAYHAKHKINYKRIGYESTT